MSIDYCEVCGAFIEGNRCRNKKAHTKISKLTSLYGDLVHRAVVDFREVRDNAQAIIDSEDSTKESLRIANAYTAMVMAYYIRFLRTQGWSSSVTFETYWGMLLNSCPDMFSAHPDLHNEFIDKFGLIYGLANGKTYAMVEDSMRYIENSLFRAYTSSDNGWVIINKQTNKESLVDFKKLRKTATEDFVMGYAKCLAHNNGWI